jgi:hypothetical protein
MAAPLPSLAARALAALLFAACLFAVAPAIAQNGTAPAAPATTSAGSGSPPATHQPAGTTVGEVKSAPGPAHSTGWGDGFWLVIGFIIIVLIAVFFSRRTSERPRP